MGSGISNICCVGEEEQNERIKELEKQRLNLEKHKIYVEAEIDIIHERQGVMIQIEQAFQNKTIKLENDKKEIFENMLLQRKAMDELQDQLKDAHTNILKFETQIEELEKENTEKIEKAIEAEVKGKMEKEKEQEIEIEINRNSRRMSFMFINRRRRQSTDRIIAITKKMRPKHKKQKTRRSNSMTRRHHSHAPFKIKLDMDKAMSHDDVYLFSDDELDSFASTESTPNDQGSLSPTMDSLSPMICPLRIQTQSFPLLQLSPFYNNGSPPSKGPSISAVISELSTELSNIEESAPYLSSKTTVNQNYDVDQDVESMCLWLQETKTQSRNEIEILKQKLVDLLANRSNGYREQLCGAFETKSGETLLKAIIGKIEYSKGSGNSLYLEIMKCVLLPNAEIDANEIYEHIQNWDLKSCAQILCCRDAQQLWFIKDAYSHAKSSDIIAQLQAISNKKRKPALTHIFENIFNFENDNNDANEVDLNQVQSDLNFLFTENVKFKADKKNRFASIFITNSSEYIRILNAQFQSKKSIKYKHFNSFIDKKMGANSTIGHWCKMHVRYSLDTAGYYASMIKDFGHHWNKCKLEIAKILVQRLEIDLFDIQIRWIEMKCYDGKSLQNWIKHKCRSHQEAYFFIKMLDNAQKYANVLKMQMKR